MKILSLHVKRRSFADRSLLVYHSKSTAGDAPSFVLSESSLASFVTRILSESLVRISFNFKLTIILKGLAKL